MKKIALMVFVCLFVLNFFSFSSLSKHIVDYRIKAQLLPAEKDGVMFIIANSADAAETITVKEDGASVTIGSVPQDSVGIFMSDGTGWAGMVVAGVVT